MKSEVDCHTLREVVGLVSQSVVSCADVQQARTAIRRYDPEIVICEAPVRENGNWQELLEDAQAAHALMLVVSQHADERLWAEVLNLGGFDVLSLPFDRDELRRALSSELRHSPRASLAAASDCREEIVMFDLKTVLLPVDFSGRSLEAARQARAIARRVRYRLIVLNVVESGESDLQFEPGGASVQELPSYLNREFGETPIEYVVEPGDPAETIDHVARKQRADLIVIGGHNRGPFEAFALGSVTAEVLCSAPCPVWVSLHEERGPAPLFRRMLCPVGLSDSTAATLDWALQFARAFDAECDVIHVAANSDALEPRRITEDRLTYAEREGLDAVKEKLDGRGRLILAAGDVASAVTVASVGLKSDLLVIGRSRSRDEVARVHSLPFTLARRAACPVVVV